MPISAYFMAMQYPEIGIRDIVFNPIQDNVYIPSHRISWINNADNSKLIEQTPKFITEAYGIPRDGVFYTTDKSRSFYKLPLCYDRKQYEQDVDYSEIKEFYTKMNELDEYFSSGEFKKRIFGDKNINKYEYQPIVREPEVSEEDLSDVERQSVIYKPPYIKLKIDIDSVTGLPSISLYDKVEDVRSVVIIEKLKDLTDHITYLTKVRLVIVIHRL